MNRYEEKLKKLDTHLEEHPKDYQSVISRLKARSESFQYQQRRKRNDRLKEIAKYRRES